MIELKRGGRVKVRSERQVGVLGHAVYVAVMFLFAVTADDKITRFLAIAAAVAAAYMLGRKREKHKNAP